MLKQTNKVRSFLCFMFGFPLNDCVIQPQTVLTHACTYTVDMVAVLVFDSEAYNETNKFPRPQPSASDGNFLFQIVFLFK
jgi:hypothetical protein